MDFNFIPYPYSEEDLEQRIDYYCSQPLAHFNEREAYSFLLSCIDLTTLEGSDNQAKIAQLCSTAISFRDDERQIKSPAAVCVYPPFVKQAHEQLIGTGIKVASVAGSFPAGQSPIEIKLAEVKYAVSEGANEIDMVISRGKFLEGNYQAVFDEIASIKSVCNNAKLKVILETGELLTSSNIYNASRLAIQAGADFIKTSTGKIAISSTPKSFLIMLDSLKNHYDNSGEMVGIKPAGGISEPEQALLYLKLISSVLGLKWLNSQFFRIGASRLASKIAEKI